MVLKMHHLVMMIICAKLFINPTIHGKLMSRIVTGFIEAYAQSLRANCDFDFELATWYLLATHCLILMIIYAKLFHEVMGRTKTGVTEAFAQS